MTMMMTTESEPGKDYRQHLSSNMIQNRAAEAKGQRGEVQSQAGGNSTLAEIRQ